VSGGWGFEAHFRKRMWGKQEIKREKPEI
jgi:hypothetical protein